MVGYLETLHIIAAGMGPQQSLKASIGSILELLSSQQQFIRPHLVIFDPQTQSLRLSVAGVPPKTTSQAYTPGVGVTGQVFITGQPVILPCMEESSVFLSKFFERSPQELHKLAFISVPVLAPKFQASQIKPQVLGVLSVDIKKTKPHILAEKCAFLQVVAAMIATQGAYLQAEMLKQNHFWPSQITEFELQYDPEHLASDHSRIPSPSESLSFTKSVENFERDFLETALLKAKGNMQEVARNLNTSYRIINYKVKKYNLLSKFEE